MVQKLIFLLRKVWACILPTKIISFHNVRGEMMEGQVSQESAAESLRKSKVHKGL